MVLCQMSLVLLFLLPTLILKYTWPEKPAGEVAHCCGMTSVRLASTEPHHTLVPHTSTCHLPDMLPWPLENGHLGNNPNHGVCDSRSALTYVSSWLCFCVGQNMSSAGGKEDLEEKASVSLLRDWETWIHYYINPKCCPGIMHGCSNELIYHTWHTMLP